MTIAIGIGIGTCFEIAIAGIIITDSFILLEDGSFILLEDGGKILNEDQE